MLLSTERLFRTEKVTKAVMESKFNSKNTNKTHNHATHNCTRNPLTAEQCPTKIKNILKDITALEEQPNSYRADISSNWSGRAQNLLV